MRISLIIILLFPLFIQAQQRLVFNDSCYISIADSANLVIDNESTNAITTVGSGGNILSEKEGNILKWNIGTATGTYTIPFTTASGVKIPLKLNITSAGVGTGYFNFSTYETSTDQNIPYPAGVTSLTRNGTDNGLYVVDRFWRLNPANYSSNPAATVAFGYDDAANEMGGSNTIIEQNLQAQCWNTSLSSWEYSLFGTVNTSINKVTGVSISSSSFYPVWILVDNSSPLPIGLKDFSVACNNEYNTINWSTATELNNAYFVIEKSTDGIHFFELKIIEGAGNSSVIRNYQISDDNTGKLVYYRLKQVDFDGTATYFKIISSNCAALTHTNLTGYFNGNNLIINYLSPHPKELDITLYSATNGQLIFKQQLLPFNGENSLPLNTNLAKGLYVLNIQHHSSFTNLKLVK